MYLNVSFSIWTLSGQELVKFQIYCGFGSTTLLKITLYIVFMQDDDYDYILVCIHYCLPSTNLRQVNYCVSLQHFNRVSHSPELDELFAVNELDQPDEFGIVQTVQVTLFTHLKDELLAVDELDQSDEFGIVQTVEVTLGLQTGQELKPAWIFFLNSIQSEGTVDACALENFISGLL